MDKIVRVGDWPEKAEGKSVYARNRLYRPRKPHPDILARMTGIELHGAFVPGNDKESLIARGEYVLVKAGDNYKAYVYAAGGRHVEVWFSELASASQ